LLRLVTGEDYDALLSVLQEATPTLARSTFTTSLITRLQKHVKNPQALVGALFSLYLVRARANESIPEFLEELHRAFVSSDDPNLNPPGYDWSTFKERMAVLLGYEKTIGITAKALGVMTEHEHVYCAAGTRVLSDLRPVFASEPDSMPDAAVIVHSLKLVYHEEGKTREFFVALDTDDLRHLGKLLKRAERKAKGLQLLLRAANVPCLDPEDGNSDDA